MSAMTAPVAVAPTSNRPLRPSRPDGRDTRAALLMTRRRSSGSILFSCVVPFIAAIWLSLHNLKLNSGHPAHWMGLEQYRRILFDSQFRGDFYRGLSNNFLFALIVVPLQTALALGLALLLNRQLQGHEPRSARSSSCRWCSRWRWSRWSGS